MASPKGKSKEPIRRIDETLTPASEGAGSFYVPLPIDSGDDTDGYEQPKPQ